MIKKMFGSKFTILVIKVILANIFLGSGEAWMVSFMVKVQL